MEGPAGKWHTKTAMSAARSLPIFTTSGTTVRELDGAAYQPEAGDPFSYLLGQLSDSGDEWASGAVPSLTDLEHGKWVLVTTPASFEVQFTNGVRLLHLADEAVRGKLRHGLPVSSWLSRYCQHAFLRIPVVHDFLDHLRKARNENQIEVLLGAQRGGRGRPLESARLLHLVSIMNALMEGGCTAAGAARELRKLRHDGLACGEARLRNLHSELSDIAKLVQEGYFIPADYLRPFVWGAETRQLVKWCASPESAPNSLTLPDAEVPADGDK